MNYITSVQAAEKWGISISRIAKMCKGGKIPGATQIGSRWMIPENLEKPLDGRTKDAKTVQTQLPFRFPFYLNFSEDSYIPPLSTEEQMLRRAQQYFYGCRFKEANEILVLLSEGSANQYIRAAAITMRCYLTVYFPLGDDDCDELMNELQTLLIQDIPYKKETELLKSIFLLDYGYYEPLFNDFFVDPKYSYHPSVRYILSLIALIPIENSDLSLLSQIRYDTQELICQMMEKDGYFFEAQQMHFLLLVVYQLKRDKERMFFHVRWGLKIGLEKELYFYPAYYYGFYSSIVQEVLTEFPADFAEKISSFGRILHENYSRFTVKRKKTFFLGVLSEEEFEYAFLATQKYSNRVIAKKMNVSEKRVSRKYNKIYEKLGIKSKPELVEIINSTHKEPAQ